MALLDTPDQHEQELGHIHDQLVWGCAELHNELRPLITRARLLADQLRDLDDRIQAEHMHLAQLVYSLVAEDHQEEEEQFDTDDHGQRG